MTFGWLPESSLLSFNRAVHIWHTQGQRFVTLILCNSPGRLCARRTFHHQSQDSYPDLRQRSRIWRSCRFNLLRRKILIRSSLASFSTSTRCGSTDLSHHMSRLKNTLDSVSKAVSGTQTEILSRIARIKAKPTQESGKEASVQSTPLHNEGEEPASAATPTSQLVPHPASSSSPLCPTSSNESTRRSSLGKTVVPAAKSGDHPVLPDVSDTSKQSTPLFHPGSFNVNLDETYHFLAHHVNSYFSGFTAQEQKKEAQAIDRSKPDRTCPNSTDPSPTEPSKDQPSSGIAPNLPSSPKKGLGQYLTYPPTVQAFVGNYIAPLVPRFRTEPKSAPVESEKVPHAESSAAKQKETTEVKEQKAAEEKAKRLLLQREKIIARVSVDNRTRALVQALRRASDVRLYISRVEELSYHLLEFPETRLVAVKEKVIPCLLRLRQAHDPSLKAAVREALTLVGYVEPVKSRGIRILSIDGGGTRGLVALQTLQKLEELSGKRIYQLFDYICGVSTGAILGFMLGVYHIPLSECEELYRKLGSDVFKQNVIVGTVKMGWRHAFYDSEVWEAVLKERMGLDLLIETSRNPHSPRVAAVSTVVNKGTPLKAYVFRNYNLPVGVRSHYRGGCRHKLWEAIRASSAAPGYFQEFTLGSDLHQDGGLLINNPTALAIHECQCLWPSTPLQCVVSLGTGRFETPSKNSATYTSLKTKLTNVISSATDTEEVHTMLDALLPPHTYFRFNPFMSEDMALDESRIEKLNQLQAEGVRYLERNENKLKRAASRLTQEKSSAQRLLEWLRLKSHMYSDLPPISKL